MEANFAIFLVIGILITGYFLLSGLKAIVKLLGLIFQVVILALFVTGAVIYTKDILQDMPEEAPKPEKQEKVIYTSDHDQEIEL